MARTRTIKPEFKDDEKLARCPRDARLTFAIMWGLCDDYGVCRAHSGWLNSNVFPYDKLPIETFEEWLHQLEREEMIVRFEAEGEHYYWLPNFLKHQRIDHPSQQRNPEPPEEIRERFANDSRGIRESSRKRLLQTETETETETETRVPPAKAGTSKKQTRKKESTINPKDLERLVELLPHIPYLAKTPEKELYTLAGWIVKRCLGRSEVAVQLVSEKGGYLAKLKDVDALHGVITAISRDPETMSQIESRAHHAEPAHLENVLKEIE